MAGRILLGTQSWSFRSWCGPFYPEEIRSSEMLGFYGMVFATLEVDATFYGIPAEPVLQAWRGAVPPGFRFALKVPQQVTHDSRLVGADEVLERFVDRVRCLEDTLGPLLIQLPPDYRPSDEHQATVERFLARLPADVAWAIEFRHRAWSTPRLLDVLGEHGVAHVLADGRWYPRETLFRLAETPTADFSYVRWMGTGPRLTDYAEPRIDREADRAAWAPVLTGLADRVKTVYGYFNNQFEGHSPHSVRAMQCLVGTVPVEPTTLHPQGDLFA